MCLSFSLDVSRFMNFIGFRKIQSGSKKKKKQNKTASILVGSTCSCWHAYDFEGRNCL